MSARTTGFHEASVKVVEGPIVEGSIMEAKEDVTTTWVTVGAWDLMVRRMEVVPLTAGSTTSVLGSAERQC